MVTCTTPSYSVLRPLPVARGPARAFTQQTGGVQAGCCLMPPSTERLQATEAASAEGVGSLHQGQRC
eukprot:8278449-Alexandrium_andersonii.AAC.1